MPSETIEQRANRPATVLRVRRYLRDIGREDVEKRTHVTCDLELGYVGPHQTVSEAAARVIALAGPPPGVREKLAAEIKLMLHASRDCMRTHHKFTDLHGAADPKHIRFDAGDGYYGEAFGILRAVHVLGWGKFGAVNIEDTLNYWFRQLEDEVLAEEHFGGSGECDICLKRYGRDDAGRSKP